MGEGIITPPPPFLIMDNEEIKKTYYERNKDRITANKRKNYAKNRAKNIERCRLWRERNREQIRDSDRIRNTERWGNDPKYREKKKTQHRQYWQSIKGKYTSYKKAAQNRGFTFNLSLDEFAGLIENRACTYCGDPATGVDRIDSSIGYLINNCTPCCKLCNRMKMNFDKELFISHCAKITNKNA
ncbi:MAG: hypothetical protein NUW09_02555 [Deltaproteobacteria bacterium]|nr:hypothetical protein [Deltaproteobacteria bacterium]